MPRQKKQIGSSAEGRFIQKELKQKLLEAIKNQIQKENRSRCRFEAAIATYKELRKFDRDNYDVLFYEFYGIGLSKPTTTFIDAFFRLLHSYKEKARKKDSSLSAEALFHDAISVLGEPTLGGKKHVSFASKLVHTVKPSFPIIDSKIRLFFNLPSQVTYDHIKKISDFYYAFEHSEDGKKEIQELVDRYPDLKDVSAVKILDFVIWSNTPSKRKGGKKNEK